MIGRAKSLNLFRLLMVTAMGILTVSCGPKAQQPLSRLDTPEHHTAIGIRLLDQEKYTDAGRAFALALNLDPRFAKASAGAALAKAYQGNLTEGRELLRQAERQARSDEEKIFVLGGKIRINTLSHAACLRIRSGCAPDDAWLKSSLEAFNGALLLDPKAADVYYFMGEAYLTAMDLEPAGRMFSRVLDLNTTYLAEADRRWKLVQKIRRAKPDTLTGRKIALVERITRADVAALFMEELQLEAVNTRRTTAGLAAMRNPGMEQASVRPSTAADIADHPLKADIEGIIRIGTRGLEVYPDGTFRPDEQVDRASYAVMIEDILVRITGDTSLATRFVGSPSPFPDVRPDLPYFNAVMVVTSRGIMAARNMMTGEFAPLQPVGGADALLVIRKIREGLWH
ncbi:MAG: S-layer homology domain-containing protein [Syntrophales bacterium]